LGPGTLSHWGPGIIVLGGSATVRGVTATGNGLGIFLDSAGNDVRGNVTTDNGIFGIDVSGTGNTIIGNYANGNRKDDLFDLNLNCDSNVWRGNDFVTASDPCIH
jgi:parallel beta-helix repeat protein